MESDQFVSSRREAKRSCRSEATPKARISAIQSQNGPHIIYINENAQAARSRKSAFQKEKGNRNTNAVSRLHKICGRQARRLSSRALSLSAFRTRTRNRPCGRSSLSAFPLAARLDAGPHDGLHHCISARCAHRSSCDRRPGHDDRYQVMLGSGFSPGLVGQLQNWLLPLQDW